MLRSGSICISFLYNYLLSESRIEKEGKGGDELIKKCGKLECLAETFASYGGVLAKLSQILCLANENDDVFSDCKPYCQKETIEYIKKEFENNKDFFKDVKSFDFNVFKSGSVGQVHKCVYKNDEQIIIKVQYVGLLKQFKSDIFILDKVATYLFHFSDLSNAMTDIKTKLYEELDYINEFKNQQTIYNLWNTHENIRIARLIPELCTHNLLAMEYIDAEGLTSFIETSTQEEKNNIGKYIIEFIFTNFYKYGIFYSDIHYGNFLIKDKNILYITDFGCLNFIEHDLLNNFIKIHKALIEEDENTFYDIVKDIGILKDDVSIESKEYMYRYFKLQYEPLISQEFEFTTEWFDIAKYKEAELMKEWILPSNCVYLNKIPYGMYHLLTKLNLRGEFLDFFKDLLDIKHDLKN